MGLPAHGAPFPLKLASFLIEFLSEPGELIVDPFGGSFTTADAAERLGRRWMSTDCMVEYVLGSATRFVGAQGYRNNIIDLAPMLARPTAPAPRVRKAA
jgi:site-specific DNA-methyltransferase (cytosine-N4-specific)